ncbi:MAG TPA: helix-turn-helix domain-containing protein [Azospirillaceae bacterium]|nr:helix-turn-helix domain-containing protein [Azospirillaceae bacterium]
MSHRHLRPDQCRAARGFLDWTQEELAHRADVSRSTVRDFEQGRHALQAESERRILAALDAAGILLIAPDDGGPGIRLRPHIP